jgi:hypothetical protein
MTSRVAISLPRDVAALSQASSPQGDLSTFPVSLAIAIGYASIKSPGIKHFVRDVVGDDVYSVVPTTQRHRKNSAPNRTLEINVKTYFQINFQLPLALSAFALRIELRFPTNRMQKSQTRRTRLHVLALAYTHASQNQLPPFYKENKKPPLTISRFTNKDSKSSAGDKSLVRKIIVVLIRLASEIQKIGVNGRNIKQHAAPNGAKNKKKKQRSTNRFGYS